MMLIARRLRKPKWSVPTRVRPWMRTKIYLGGMIVVSLVLLGIMGPYLAPFDPNEQQLRETLRPPEWFVGSHFLGTDNLGRDILSRLMHGARVSLIVGFAVILISGVIGVTLGATSGYFGGKIDFLVQKVVEVFWAFPDLLIAIAILAFLGQSLPNLIIAFVARRWIQYNRIVRGETLSLREREYVIAARALGARDRRIILHHVLPNLIPSIVVIGTFAMAQAIILESALSFLGLGVPPSIPTWGTMLADGRSYMSTAGWLTIFPGLAIFTTVMGVNLLGDGLRDVLDPRMKIR